MWSYVILTEASPGVNVFNPFRKKIEVNFKVYY